MGPIGTHQRALKMSRKSRTHNKTYRSGRGTLTMLHITEDTPPDMLAGAMDLTVHLPNGKTVKMAVERSTPMMDLLVQITTNNHLQLSNYTLQVLGMAPSVEHSDKILPFKPNTPVGALDTQHVKVLPKGKTLPAPKHPPPPGHQPFESTFRLKVHLPRNQLYVTRVSRNVYLEDIMRKVCEEKNLDPGKFELKHPGNLEETLDPKLTLSDYQITEIYLVHKGTSNLNQALSSTDIMTLRKEEERKQMHTKTGGGVFNLIFKRNKSSMSSGSVSSDTRSLSPTQSDDSRSVTPPGVEALPIVARPKREPPERPKPPQRKRRPAPLPPPQSSREEGCQKENDSEENTLSEISKGNTDQSQSSTARETISENGLTICHSRNSSDSSGYHEASILSDHNTSLPRARPMSAFVTSDMQQMAMASGSNLSKMAAHSRSTTSLVTGRKKKAPAPPPPPCNTANIVPVSPSSSVVSASSENPSPLVASQTIPTLTGYLEVQASTFTPTISNPKPFPRKKIKTSERTAEDTSQTSDFQQLNLAQSEATNHNMVNSKSYLELSGSQNLESMKSNVEAPKAKPRKEQINSKNSLDSLDNLINERDSINKKIVDDIIKEKLNLETASTYKDSSLEILTPSDNIIRNNEETMAQNESETLSTETVSTKQDLTTNTEDYDGTNSNFYNAEESESNQHTVLQPKFLIGEQNLNFEKDLLDTSNFKPLKNREPSLEEMLSSLEAVNSFVLEDNLSLETATNTTENITSSNASVTQIQKCIVSNIFSSSEFLKETKPPEVVGVIPKTRKAEKLDIFESDHLESNTTKVLELDFEKKNRILTKNLSTSSLRSFEFSHSSDNTESMKKWSNTEKLHDSSLTYFAVKNDWVTGDADDTDSVTSNNIPLDTCYTLPIDNIISDNSIEEEKTLESTDSGIAQDKNSDTEKSIEDLRFGMPPIIFEESPKVGKKHVFTTGICIKEETLTDRRQDNLVQKTSEEEKVVRNEVCKAFEECENDIQVKTVENNISKTFITNNNSEMEELVEYKKKCDILQKQNIVEMLNQQKDAVVNNIEPSKVVFSGNTQKSQSFVLPQECERKDKNSQKIIDNSKCQHDLEKPTLDQTQHLQEIPKIEKRPTSLTLKQQKETDLFEIDWQYQLPSPPKAFRDSPTNLTDTNDCDTKSATEFKDSVVTQPDLFEKLHNFDPDNASETDTLKSEVTSIASEEILNTLSLEHLEKRRSLVYNRELATSLKMNSNSMIQESRDIKSLRPSRSSNRNTLPNFKITTYDVPKQKIKVFEDDTIRSNVNNVSNLRKSNFAQSMENVSKVHEERQEYSFFRPKSKNSEANSTVQRSESFFTDRSNFRPVSRSQSHLTLNKFRDSRMEKSNSTLDVSGLQSIGVMRLIQNRLSTPTSSLENLSQSIHSQTPHNSIPTTLPPKIERENAILSIIDEDSRTTQHEVSQNRDTEEIIVSKIEKEPDPLHNNHEELTVLDQIKLAPTSESKTQLEPEKRYRYSGPPTINMATWSERPKVPVHVREDPDYKLGNHDNVVASKLIVNSAHNNVSCNNSVEIRNIRNTDVIKIDSYNSDTTNKNLFSKNFESSRFQAPLGYRKPFQNINKNTVSYTPKQRPHSIAFDSDFDISRVPVVRSVEFKKPYKDIYTSVTHINPKSNIETDNFNNNNNNIDSNYASTDILSSNTNFDGKVFTVNRFKTSDIHAPPIVRGFRTPSNPTNRLSWNPSSYTSSTLPSKSKQEPNFTTNQHVPFSQSNLKRTESNRLLKEDISENISSTKLLKEEEPPFNSLPLFNSTTKLTLNDPTAMDKINKRNVSQNYTPPPPPPQMPIATLRKVPQKEIKVQKIPVDAKDMLMESIRSFGGKKGLKSVKS